MSLSSSFLSADTRIPSPGRALAQAAAWLSTLVRGLDERLDERYAADRDAGRDAGLTGDLFTAGRFVTVQQAD